MAKLDSVKRRTGDIVKPAKTIWTVYEVQELLDDITEDVDALYTRREELKIILNHIDHTASSSQTLPLQYRHEYLRLNLENLAGSLADAFTEWSIRHDAYNIPIPEGVAEGVNQRIIGVKRALNDQDGGSYLYELAKGQSELHALIGSVRPNIKLGRKSEPTPVHKFILQETRRLKQLHVLNTRGDQVDSFISWLETFPDVQRWKANPQTALPKDTSQELQAYLVFYWSDREERREKLRQIERDNPRY